MTFEAGEKVKYRHSEHHPWMDAVVHRYEEEKEVSEVYRYTLEDRLWRHCPSEGIVESVDDIPRASIFGRLHVERLPPCVEPPCLHLDIVVKDAIRPSGAFSWATLRGEDIDKQVKKIN